MAISKCNIKYLQFYYPQSIKYAKQRIRVNHLKNSKIIMQIISVVFTYLFITADLVYAYFDPGTGSFIIQSIIGLFGVIIFYLGYPFRVFKKIITYIKSSFSKKNTNAKN